MATGSDHTYSVTIECQLFFAMIILSEEPCMVETLLSCNHAFHTICLMKHLSEGSYLCPVCDGKIPILSIYELEAFGAKMDNYALNFFM